jgi:hypothetical protein
VICTGAIDIYVTSNSSEAHYSDMTSHGESLSPCTKL